MKENYQKIAILIPAFNPNENLLELARDLSLNPWYLIIIINDGSSEESKTVLDTAKRIKNVQILNHTNNLGKGAALKTGIDYILKKTNAIDGLITVDSDGQHLIKDIKNIALASQQNKNNVVFGVRSFDNSTPIRSRFGNKLTQYLLYIFNGISIQDSQTGLRFLPISILNDLLQLPGKRYDFELECLFAIRKLEYKILQIKISTVYINENEDSHFRPLIDSAKIYAVFARFSLSSLLSFGLDIIIFSICLIFFKSIFLSTLLARIVSGIFNFTINKKFVFKSKNIRNLTKEIIGYFILWSSLLILSGLIVSSEQGSALMIIIPFKIFVDLLLFIAAFYIQKNIIFKIKNITTN
jgi:glycosyltransferase involved in cell wall biosynthesis